MLRKVKYIVTTIKEPYPVFFKGLRQGEEEGPFHAPNSQWHHLYSELDYEWKKRSAQYLRDRGYTVTVDIVIRETQVYGPRNGKAECFVE